jgi:hypothetical protein
VESEREAAASPAFREPIEDAVFEVDERSSLTPIELQGSVPAPMTQEQFRALIVAEQAKWKLVIESVDLNQQHAIRSAQRAAHVAAEAPRI